MCGQPLPAAKQSGPHRMHQTLWKKKYVGDLIKTLRVRVNSKLLFDIIKQHTNSPKMNTRIEKALRHLAQAANQVSTSKSPLPKGLNKMAPQTKEDIDCHLTAKEILLQTPRKTLQKNVSIAEYLEEEDVVMVTEKKGSHWMTLGHWLNGQTQLYPEEVVYAMESGVLMVYERGVPWTIQQAYHTLIKKEQQLLTCQVYSHLKRAGYVVRRRNHDNLNGYDCVLDIYKEQKSFRKTSPGSPDCVVVVVRPQDHFPTPSELEYLTANVVPVGSQLKYAVVDCGEVSYHSLYKLDGIPSPLDK